MYVHEVFRRLGLLNAGMALASLSLAILITFSDHFANGESNTSDTTIASKATNPILDPKRRNDLVDEAFLEQKDILLSMLENKLKEVRDKKRRKVDRSDSSNKENTTDTYKCDFLPNNVDLKLKSNGIVGIGETDLQLKFAESGNNNLDLNATGISNVGKINMNLGMGNGSLQIPGLKDLFNEGPCGNQNQMESDNQINGERTDVIPIELSRRSLESSSGSFNESSSTISESDHKIDNTIQTLLENVTESVTGNSGNLDKTSDI